MSPEEKEKAKQALREAVAKYKEETFTHWLHLFEMDETMRKHCGYSQGSEDMIQKLVRTHHKEMGKLMKPFDRGDFD